jgi:dihydropteroate synthase
MTATIEPSRPNHWQLRSCSVSLANRPLIMGIINVTPDSFSDGGLFHDSERAIDHALQLAEQGADLLDVGGESTRPFSTPVESSEELERVIPVITKICQHTHIPVSIDTSKAVVARAALRAGAQIVNDVTGLEGDPEMLSLVAESGAGVCVMHMAGTPATMQGQSEVWGCRGRHRLVPSAATGSFDGARGRHGPDLP